MTTATTSSGGGSRADAGFVGSLAHTPLAEVLRRIAVDELSGDLQVTSPSAIKTIYFDRGFVVFAASNSKSDRLGQLLIRTGQITDADLDEALRLMGGKRRIGEALVGEGLLSEEELGQALGYQARAIATSLFAFMDGMYRFEEQTCPIPLELRLSLSIYRILLEGVRIMKNGPLIAAGLPSKKSVVRLAPVPPFSFEDVRFRPEELLVMEAAQKGRTLQGILERVPKKKGIVLRTTYGLLSAGVLQREDEKAPLKVQEETGTFLMSNVERQEKDPEAENVRQEVLLAFENSEHATPNELLEVGAEATEEEIRRAYVAKQEVWDHKQKELEKEKTLFLKVDEIKTRLERAKMAMLEQNAAPPPPPAKPKAAFRTAEDRDEVKRLLKEIKLRQMVNDKEGVISFLYEVVKRAPENPKFEAMLAQALASHPVMKSKAERHFRKALSLDPQNAEYHYLLGRYYQAFNMKNRALAEFKAALRIDPKLAPARSALVEVKGEEASIQDKLKQMFA